ncbi:hypothetical protein [Fervidobacterium sp.]
MSLKISLGGDLVYYLGVVGLLKALDETNLEGVELHCSGFSCIPAILWLSKKQAAYNTICNLWNDALKLFKGASKPSFENIAESMLLLYKMQRRVNELDSKEKLSEFVEKWIPKYEITKDDFIKIHAYNITKNKDEILTGNSHDILLRTLPNPLDFSPIDSYISSSWVIGIPEGDVIIYIDWFKPFKPKRATDYLLISTFARTSEIIQFASKNAKTVLKVHLSSSNDIKSISTKFYFVGKEFVKMWLIHKK